jgi:NAD(P)-dependent dehydrogenase (short-subunit alcohol dehydrogenase family)/acyl dehydratase
MPITLTQDDLASFAAASHDRNPLHVSADYARRTAFGQPVAHGALATLHALAHLRPRRNAVASRVVVDFTRPIFAGIAYDAEVSERSGDKSTVTLRDGKRTCLRATVSFREGTLGARLTGATPQPERVAVDRAFESIEVGARVGGEYMPASRAAEQYVDRLALGQRGVGAWHVAALMGASYVVGMEMPGTRALFSHVSLEFEGLAGATGPLKYDAVARNVDPRFELVQMEVRFEAGGLCARGELGAFVRRPAVALRPDLLKGLPAPDALTGKRALVVGASRGLGAALALALARCGARVIATYASCSEAARTLERAAQSASGSVETKRADATDADAYAGFSELDLLVCSASPPLLPLDLSPPSRARFDAFVTESLRMVSAPLAATMPALEKRGGGVVLISSVALQSPPEEWPHYVTAKAAIEGLARAMASANPDVGFLVVRPPRLQTDMTNSVRGHEFARSAEEVAAAIARRVAAGLRPGVAMLAAADDPALAEAGE